MPLPRDTCRRLGRDRGAVTLELAFLAVPLLMALGFAIVVGRLTMAGSSVDAAAKAAARQASITRDGTAETSAKAAAAEVLRQDGVDCTQINVSLSFTSPGKGALVTATVECTVTLSDAGLPGLPGSKTMSATVISPVDRFRDPNGGRP